MENFFYLSDDFMMMFIRLLINCLFTWLIIDRLYYRKSRRRDFYFTFMLISVAIFFIVFFMIFVLEDMKGKTSMGVGIGLFGIFSIMRYRTDAMPVREMTYLFVIIELKRDGHQPSPILPKLLQLRIHPHGFSKYCIGSALTNEALRRNRFKPRLHYVQKLLNE